MKPSKKPNPFKWIIKDNLVEVWLGEVDEFESEFVFSIDKSWLPELIESLRSVK